MGARGDLVAAVACGVDRSRCRHCGRRWSARRSPRCRCSRCELEHRAPRRDVVAHGADGEDRQRGCRCSATGRPSHHDSGPRPDRCRGTGARRYSRVHAVGHARRVGVPGHQVGHRRALAHQVVVHAGATRSGRSSAAAGRRPPSGWCRGSPAATSCPRGRRTWLSSMNSVSSPASLKSVCAASRRQRREPLVVRRAPSPRRRSPAACRPGNSRRRGPSRSGTMRADGVERRHRRRARGSRPCRGRGRPAAGSSRRS